MKVFKLFNQIGHGFQQYQKDIEIIYRKQFLSTLIPPLFLSPLSAPLTFTCTFTTHTYTQYLRIIIFLRLEFYTCLLCVPSFTTLDTFLFAKPTFPSLHFYNRLFSLFPFYPSPLLSFLYFCVKCHLQSFYSNRENLNWKHIPDLKSIPNLE